VDKSGKGNYTKIQDAIDAINANGVIYIHNGTYYERLTIDKPLTLIGESRENVTVV